MLEDGSSPALSVRGRRYAPQGLAVGHQKLLGQERKSSLGKPVFSVLIYRQSWISDHWAAAKHPQASVSQDRKRKLVSHCVQGHQGGNFYFPQGFWSFLNMLQVLPTSFWIMRWCNPLLVQSDTKCVWPSTVSTDEGQAAADVLFSVNKETFDAVHPSPLLIDLLLLYHVTAAFFWKETLISTVQKICRQTFKWK